MKPLKYYKSDRGREPSSRRRGTMTVTKGDTVVVLSGDDKGKRGKVLRALPTKQRVVVDGINVVKRHRKAQQQGEESAIVSFPAPIHVSKVMLIDPKDDAPTRVRRRVDKDGTVERVAVRSGQTIPRNR